MAPIEPILSQDAAFAARAVPSAPRPDDALSLVAKAELTAATGALSEAISLAEAAASASRVAADAATLARANGLLVLLYRRAGRPEAAIVAGQAALPWLVVSGSHALRSEVLCHMTMCFNELRLFQDALHHVSDAVEAAKQSGDRRLLCWAYNRIGSTNSAIGRFTEAQQFLAEALAIARELGGNDELFAALNNLLSAVGDSATRRIEAGGSVDESLLAEVAMARAWGEEALALARASGNAFKEAIALGSLAQMVGLGGGTAEASELFAQARSIAVTKGYTAVLQRCDSAQAMVAAAGGQAQEAAALLKPWLRGKGVSDRNLVLQMERQMYVLEKSRGRYKQALDHHETVLQMSLLEHEQTMDVQSRLVLNRLELAQAKFAAERAQMESKLQKAQAARMGLEARNLADTAQRLSRLALEDPLTCLGNRRLMDRDLPRMLQAAYSSGGLIAVALIDIDHFKNVNDVHGHHIGDIVLQHMADILRLRTRGHDLVVRMGGEEFVVVLAQASPSQAFDACERLRSAVERFDWGHIAPALVVTVSIGLCVPVVGTGATEALEYADQALCAAKRGGRNRLVQFAAE